jgi:hypothetical protein
MAPSIRKKLAITSPTSGGRSVGRVRSRTQTMEFSLVYELWQSCWGPRACPRARKAQTSNFRNAVFSNYLEYRTMDKVHKPWDSGCYTPSSELFRIYSNYSLSVLIPTVTYTGWRRETGKFEIIRKKKNEGNLQNFIWSWKCVQQEWKFH